MSSTGRRVGDRADRDQVDAGGGVGADRLEGDAPADLEQRRRSGGPSTRERATQSRTSSGVMLSSSTRRHRPRAPRRPASSRSHSTWTVRPGHVPRARSTASAIPSAGEVVVLEQHPVGQVAPVVGAAAGAHRRLLERAQARAWSCGCPRSEPAAGRRGRVDEPPGERGDAREVAEEVQRRALGGEDRRQRPVDPADRLPGGDAVAVVGGPGPRRPRRRPGRRPRRHTPMPARTPATPGHERRPSLVAASGSSADVRSPSGREVLGERARHRGPDVVRRWLAECAHWCNSLPRLPARR